ncbi:uncharacterized protein LOC129759771, partial [Uranotaenia lowii]|uniref:uncharacterized protein LOC129759771 n=1 Tax=Uranotaenia lowii TaxID=190385 RepID=UPI00247B0AE4
LRFDEIGHDLFTDSDSLSYASLSRSSSLIQFESLERQLQNESVAVASVPLSGSSPSLFSLGGGSAGAGSIAEEAQDLGCGTNGVGADSLGSFYISSPGKKNAGLLTASNLKQQNQQLKAGGVVGGNIGCNGVGAKQPALNVSDSELYSSSSVSSSSGSSSGGGSSCNYASDECDLNHGHTPSPSESQVTKSSSDEAEGSLVRCPQRCSERRRSFHQLKSKNSVESLSEDSGYCDHLHFNMNNLKVKSKSLTNFGSAENVNIFMEPQQPPPDYFEQRHVSFHQENRLSTVCDEDEEQEEETPPHGMECEEGREVHHMEESQCNSEESLSNKYDSNKVEQQLWYGANAKTNIHNCTKIDLDTSKHSRTPGFEHPQQSPSFVVTTKTIPPVSPSTSPSPAGSNDSLERRRHPAHSGTIATALDRHHGYAAEPKPKNSHRRPQQRDDAEQLSSNSRKRPRSQQQQQQNRRRRTIISASSPDLFSSEQRPGALLLSSLSSSGSAGSSRSRSRKQQQQRKVSDFLEYGAVNFTVSSVPECLNLCGSGGGREEGIQSDSLDSFELCESGPSSGNYCSWNQNQPDSVASKNFDLYDYRGVEEVPVVVKNVKTVTFQTSARPRVNIRASYANLTALDYGDDEDGNQYYLSRNTFRTSSGTKLGGVREMAGSSWDRKKLFDEDDEEEKIFPVESDEKSTFDSLLDEISAHFDRNLSIINDQAEMYEPIATFLNEQRASSRSSSFQALVSPPAPPPRRTQIKTNPHHTQPGPTMTTFKPQPGVKKRTFDQDPTNLVTCYAASLERCTFDPSESTLNLYNSNNSTINKTSDLNINQPAARKIPSRYAPKAAAAANKREFVASTPNLNYFYGSSGGAGNEDEGGLNAAHHNSLKNVSCLEIGGTGGELGSRSTGILATSSKCGLSKGVSFCPIVSEIIWKDNSGSELDQSDNGSVISNQDFEIDVDDDDFDQYDYDHANLIATQTNTLINANSVETGLCELINKADSSTIGDVQYRNETTTPTLNDFSNQNQRADDRLAALLAESGDVIVRKASLSPERVDDQSSERDNNNGAAGRLTAPSARSLEASSSKVITAEEGSMKMASSSAIANGVDASRNLIGSESAFVVPPPVVVVENVAPVSGQLELEQPPRAAANPAPEKFVNNNNNLIKNFKNGKAEKKGKTFLSRLSSGFRFSFRGKSKKNNKDGVNSGSSKAGAARIDKQNSSSPGKVKDSSNNDKVSTDFIYIPLKDPAVQHHSSSNGFNNGSGSGAVIVDDEQKYLRQMNTVGLEQEKQQQLGEDEPDRVYDANESDVTLRSDSMGILNSSSASSTAYGGPQNHVLSGKPPLPKLPPRVVGVSAKRPTQPTASSRFGAHAQLQRASSTPPRTEIDLDESHRSYHLAPQYGNGSDTDHNDDGAFEGLSVSALVGRYSLGERQAAATGHHHYNRQHPTLGGAAAADRTNYFNHIMGSEQKIGLIETNLDTHETIISGKTRSLMELGGPAATLQVHHPGNASGHGGVSKRGGAGGIVNGIKDRQTSNGGAGEPGRPHKSMEFLLDKENQRNVL